MSSSEQMVTADTKEALRVAAVDCTRSLFGLAPSEPQQPER
jgi:hypothetical protein